MCGRMRQDVLDFWPEGLPTVEYVAAQMNLPVSTVLGLLMVTPPKLSALLDKVGRACRDGDLAEAVRSAHSIKGVCASMRLNDMSQMARGIERCLSDQPDFPAALALCDKIRRLNLVLDRQLAAYNR